MERARNRTVSFEEAVVSIVQDAGGKIVGRTRLQKIGCLLELAELGHDFKFEYRHYGPYCEELAAAASNARAHNMLKEEEKDASWGGVYSIFTVDTPIGDQLKSDRSRLVSAAAEADAIELELAVTAAFLAKSKVADPWDETAQRKPKKAEEGRLNKAKALYAKLRKIAPENSLPEIS